MIIGDFAFWYTLIIIISMSFLLIKEIIEPEFVIFLALLLLVNGKIITVNEALVGFSNSGMLTVGFLFVIADALKKTGV